MHYISDLQITGTVIGLLIHLIGSTTTLILIYRKAVANGVGIERNHHDIAGLDASNTAIQTEMVIVRNALTRIQAHIEGRVPRTRVTDPPGTSPLPMRSPSPKIAGVSPIPGVSGIGPFPTES